MNKRLEEISAELFLLDSPEFPISIGDTVIMRSEGTRWVPCVYLGYSAAEIQTRLFRAGELWHSMVAPMAGNEDVLFTTDDPFNMIDRSWMIESGLLEAPRDLDYLDVIELQLRTPVNMDKDVEELR